MRQFNASNLNQKNHFFAGIFIGKYCENISIFVGNLRLSILKQNKNSEKNSHFYGVFVVALWSYFRLFRGDFLAHFRCISGVLNFRNRIKNEIKGTLFQGLFVGFWVMLSGVIFPKKNVNDEKTIEKITEKHPLFYAFSGCIL